MEIEKISVIIPTYNEKENITKLIPAIHNVLKGYEYELIVIDDNSPDGTAEMAEKLSKIYPIRVLKRSGKFGLASAILYGLQNSKGDILGVIDADLQHPPEYMKGLIQEINNGYDIAVGSRYIGGGKTEGWSIYRSVVSKGAVILSRPLTDIKDPMSGYFFLKKCVIKDISFSSIGYKILLEILTKCSYENVKEVPYIFKTRQNGNSKLGKSEYINYLKLLYSLYSFKLNKIFEKWDEQ